MRPTQRLDCLSSGHPNRLAHWAQQGLRRKLTCPWMTLLSGKLRDVAALEDLHAQFLPAAPLWRRGPLFTGCSVRRPLGSIILPLSRHPMRLLPFLHLLIFPLSPFYLGCRNWPLEWQSFRLLPTFVRFPRRRTSQYRLNKQHDYHPAAFWLCLAPDLLETIFAVAYRETSPAAGLCRTGRCESWGNSWFVIWDCYSCYWACHAHAILTPAAPGSWPLLPQPTLALSFLCASRTVVRPMRRHPPLPTASPSALGAAEFWRGISQDTC